MRCITEYDRTVLVLMGKAERHIHTYSSDPRSDPIVKKAPATFPPLPIFDPLLLLLTPQRPPSSPLIVPTSSPFPTRHKLQRRYARVTIMWTCSRALVLPFAFFQP
ncbi:hypothetical protein BDV24DRAFT_144108 [Aspergillus arachidicola]|uniref:Uncharacterized protein n=1 Tax=Aspergillus arachidicola TaxID=656916 RepID=A0A5N6XQ27_9EURO|nr:hypothetical protein BDV24DRAFT_144108 [Aspergillus arachidicola]